MSTETIIVETRGRVGLIRLNRPHALNALNSVLQNELLAAAENFDADEQYRLHRHYRVGEGVRGRCRHQGYGRQVLSRRAQQRFLRRLRAAHATAQADHRGGCGLCARRRLRSGDDVRHHHCRRYRQVRSTRDQARGDPRHGRDAAAHARDRQGQGHGSHPDGSHDGRGGGGAIRPRGPGRAGCRSHEGDHADRRI